MQTQTQLDVQRTALTRALSGQSLTNYNAIYDGFAAKGIPIAEIEPRRNVFTFNAWKALGRTVLKGEHGVKITTFKTVTKRDKETGKEDSYSMPWHSTVFHISQTDELKQA